MKILHVPLVARLAGLTLLGGVLLTPGVFGTVFAVTEDSETTVTAQQDSPGQATDSEASATSEAEASTDDSASMTEQEKTDMKDRAASRVAKYKVSLRYAEKVRIQNRCVAAQAKIGAVQKKLEGIRSDRPQIYGAFADNLSPLAERFQTFGLDTQALEDSIAGLKERTQTYATVLKEYGQAIDDTAALDCKANPENFKASLEDARAQLGAVQAAAAAIREQVKNVIKPELQLLRQQLDSVADAPADEAESTIEGDE